MTDAGFSGVATVASPLFGEAIYRHEAWKLMRTAAKEVSQPYNEWAKKNGVEGRISKSLKNIENLHGHVDGVHTTQFRLNITTGYLWWKEIKASLVVLADANNQIGVYYSAPGAEIALTTARVQIPSKRRILKFWKRDVPRETWNDEIHKFQAAQRSHLLANGNPFSRTKWEFVKSFGGLAIRLGVMKTAAKKEFEKDLTVGLTRELQHRLKPARAGAVPQVA